MRPICLTSAEFLQLHFIHSENSEHLEDAIKLHREAFILLPPGYNGRARSLNSLASCLTMQYTWQGDLSILEEAIVHLRQCLLLEEEGVQKQFMYLENLGRALLERFSRCGDSHDLKNATHNLCEAIEARHPHPPGPLEWPCWHSFRKTDSLKI